MYMISFFCLLLCCVVGQSGSTCYGEMNSASSIGPHSFLMPYYATTHGGLNSS